LKEYLTEILTDVLEAVTFGRNRFSREQVSVNDRQVCRFPAQDFAHQIGAFTVIVCTICTVVPIASLMLA
jgi:hypothetical protein